jgi:hypothetical protein
MFISPKILARASARVDGLVIVKSLIHAIKNAKCLTNSSNSAETEDWCISSSPLFLSSGICISPADHCFLNSGIYL